MDAILVVNAGSSSVKFQIFGIEQAGAPRRLIKGQLEGIGTHPRLFAQGSDKSSLIDRTYTAGEIADVPAAIATVASWLRETQTLNLLSYEYIAHRLREVAPTVAAGRVIVAHLGSGASMCALANGRSVESTMDFTALDGIPMGTRPGQIDPGVLLYLLSEKGMTPAAVQDLLYHESGLMGLSGISNDMRDLQSNSDPRAKLAVENFVYRVGLSAGMLAAALGGLDAFVFTAGIGENSPTIRARIAEKLAWLGAVLDRAANADGKSLISRPESRVAVLVVPTDEELMIAQHTLAFLPKSTATSTHAARDAAAMTKD
jgi:acetate kinase